ncbi:MAG: hypothetical protein SFZ03_02335 [Candidatus Melainabacteria bacterium]|nr:hypothetical protein [Candidatus Melainabacteria bacterium]
MRLVEPQYHRDGRRLGQAFVLLVMLAVGLGLEGRVWAYAPEADLMKIKGYSPETIQSASLQRSRQEWRQPAPPRMTPKEKFFHNLYYNNWTGGVDDFGSQIIRTNP